MTGMAEKEENLDTPTEEKTPDSGRDACEPGNGRDVGHGRETGES